MNKRRTQQNERWELLASRSAELSKSFLSPEEWKKEQARSSSIEKARSLKSTRGIGSDPLLSRQRKEHKRNIGLASSTLIYAIWPSLFVTAIRRKEKEKRAIDSPASPEPSIHSTEARGWLNVMGCCISCDWKSTRRTSYWLSTSCSIGREMRFLL